MIRMNKNVSVGRMQRGLNRQEKRKLQNSKYKETVRKGEVIEISAPQIDPNIETVSNNMMEALAALAVPNTPAPVSKFVEKELTSLPTQEKTKPLSKAKKDNKNTKKEKEVNTMKQVTITKDTNATANEREEIDKSSNILASEEFQGIEKDLRFLSENIEVVNEFFEALERATKNNNYQSSIRNLMSRVDQEVSDFYHTIEFAEPNAYEGYLLTKGLKDALKTRRVIKEVDALHRSMSMSFSEKEKKILNFETLRKKLGNIKQTKTSSEKSKTYTLRYRKDLGSFVRNKSKQ